jgi:Mg2+/Co2+ transporter CorB
MFDSYMMQGALVILLLVLSAFFSASEIGILSASRSKIHKLKLDGNKRAITLSKLRDDRERMIGAMMLLNTFVNTACATIASGLSIDYFGDSGQALAISTVVMTILIMIYGEILPKTYAVRNAEKLSLVVAPFFMFISKVFAPITSIIQILVNATLRILTSPTKKEEKMSGLEIMRGALEFHHEEGLVISEDRYMIGGIIDLEKITVDEIMIHRNDMDSIDIDDEPSEIIAQMISSTHSRVPLWKDEPDNIVGIVHIKDVIRIVRTKKEAITRKDIDKITRKPWFIANITTLKKQLNAFREQQSHFALVVDEYGELLGLITLEDILEEVVGHIEDEYDQGNKQAIKKSPDGSVVVEGDVTIRDLNRFMHWDISDEDASTVGGLVFHIAQKVPSIGESFKFSGFRFKILKRKHNKIVKVKIVQLKSKKKVGK